MVLVQTQTLAPMKRMFKNLVVNSDGKKLTFSDESMQCFGDDGDWMWFTIDVK